MSEMGFENVFYLENFECAGDEVLVESSPPASPEMAARLAAPAQSNGAGGGASPSTVRELIVIPELPNSIHLQHAIQQVSSTVVEVNGDSSGQSSPNADAQHAFITVAMDGAWQPKIPKAEPSSDNERNKDTGNEFHSFAVRIKNVEAKRFERTGGEGGNGVNYHVQYVTEPQEIYAQGHQMETLRSYPVYGVATVSNGGVGNESAAEGAWAAASTEYAYGLVASDGECPAVAGDEAEAPGSPATAGAAPRMPPATVQWLLDHYETAEGVSLPRSTLYAHYLRHCSAHRLEPVNAASFGKLIRSVFVGLRTRRLGTRGNSKYHYYGIRAKPSAIDDRDDSGDDKSDGNEKQEEGARGSCPLGAAAAAHRQYLGSGEAPEPPPLQLAEPADEAGAGELLRAHHRAHGAAFLAAAAALDAQAVEAARRAFWRRAWCRRALARLAARADVCRWLRAADTQLYQCAVEMLLPDVLRPIPPQLTQAIRNFAKSVEGALAAGSSGAPLAAARAGAAAAAALAGALRRYTSLNHLAQAARAVLTNHHQIHQMVSDLNRVDFRVVREQAAWACACASQAHALKLEADFKATLGRGATLEQWAEWLEGCVRGALAPHDRRPDLLPRARRLLLDWSFYSSLVIRELTLRSAASFGSFHLLRLLYDEYVAYLIERRVAAHLAAPPIAVLHHRKDEEDPDSTLEAREVDDDEPDWEWGDEDEDEDEPDAKKQKLEAPEAI